MCSGKCQGAAAREWLAEREASAAHSIAGIIGRRGHSHFGRVEDGRGENTWPLTVVPHVADALEMGAVICLPSAQSHPQASRPALIAA
jgi:hypothetical protein